MPPRSRALLTVALAGAALAVTGCGSSDDDTTTAATATIPTTAIDDSATTTPVTTTPATTATIPAPPPPPVITASNGKRYRCIGPSLLSDLRTTSRRIERGRTSLKRIRSELRRLKKRYPGGVAPPRVAQRYNYLLRKGRALLRLGNKRVRAYNRRLDRDCLRR